MCATWLLPQKRIDRHEGAAGCGGAEDRRDGLDPLVEEDRHALLPLEANSRQPAGHAARPMPQLGVAQRRALERQRRRLRVRGRALLQQVVQVSFSSPSGHFHGWLSSPSHAGELTVEVIDLVRAQVGASVHLRSR